MTPEVLAAIYLRLSDLRADDMDASGQTSLPDREKRLRKLADQLGWTVAVVLIENDVREDGTPKPASAFKRQRVRNPDGSWAVTPWGAPVWRVLRPAFRRGLEYLTAGRIQAVLAEDLDRTFRDPKDLEDFIDVMQQTGGHARSLSGSLSFTSGGTDAELTMARVMVAMAWKSSRDTSRRVAAARLRRAEAGQNGGGRRPFGFRPDGLGGLVVDESEAAVIREAADAVLRAPRSHRERSDPKLARDDSVTLKALARDLRERGVPTVTGARWTPDTLGAILVRPMNAGLSVHRGKLVDVPAGLRPAWMTDPILDRETWEAVVERLTDRDRRTSTGNAPKWMGSGIYRCGICGEVMRVKGTGAGRPRYTCAGPVAHLGRAAEPLDRYAGAMVVRRLSEPDAAELFRPAPVPGVDRAALKREARKLEMIGKGSAERHALGDVSDAEYYAGARVRKMRLDAIAEQLAVTTEADPLAEFRDAYDVRETWNALPLQRKREVLRLLFDVTVLSAKREHGGPGLGGHRSPGFVPELGLNPDLVRMTPHDDNESDHSPGAGEPGMIAA